MEITVNDGNFDSEVIKESKLPVLVDFWAEWCGPCRMIAPMIEEIAREYQGKVKVCKINVDEAPKTASELGVMSIPTIAIFKNGKVVNKIVGAVPKQEIVSRINTSI
ncbi:MAG TPA: thioredoxin [Candidatus Omnitrophota bacterium]|nr:thioredoxin [Candidatus Omnitrophota bacterium]HPS19841.1 thioredoxin [Candidatus Omnitrophota bacterium]